MDTAKPHRANGRPPMPPDLRRTKPVHVRLRRSEHEAARRLARSRGLTVPELVRSLLDREASAVT